MENKTQATFVKSKKFMRDWSGVILGFLLALSTTLMSIIDFSSIEGGNIFKELTIAMYVLIGVSVIIKGISNMYIFRVFIKSGIDIGKKDEEYQTHLDYQDEQITKCLPYKREIDAFCKEDNYNSLKELMTKYCNHKRLIFSEVVNEDLSLNENYVPKGSKAQIRKEKRAIKNIYKECQISEISTELLFDTSVGGWQRHKSIVLEKEYLAKNSSTTVGMLFSILTSILSIAPFMFSVSGLIMAGVNFGIIVGMAWYKRMNSITYVKEDLGGEIMRRGLKLETFYIEIKREESKKIIVDYQPEVKVEELKVLPAEGGN